MQSHQRKHPSFDDFHWLFSVNIHLRSLSFTEVYDGWVALICYPGYQSAPVNPGKAISPGIQGYPSLIVTLPGLYIFTNSWRQPAIYQSMNKSSMGPLRPMILVFILMNAFFLTGNSILIRWGADQAVLILGNLLLFLASLFSFLLLRRSFADPNPNVFVRAVYTSFIAKFFLCGIAAAVYVLSTTVVNKPALIGCMLLYALYTFIEVSSLMKLLKQKKNA